MIENRKIVLVDMDEILVDMLSVWLNEYNNLTKELVNINTITNYNMKLYVKDYKLLYSIIEKKDFFYNLCPISGSIKWFQKLIDDERFLTMVVTQPPRTCDFAVGDKRRWIKTYFPNFDLTNIIFTHKKFLIKGDVLFDDCADHLFNWNMNNVKGITAKILYPYNNNMPADWTFNDKNKAWEEFYYKLDKQFK